MNELLPVIFDTDIGSDIDDALALAYLLKQPRCELVGVTTVTGDVSRRAALAEVLCRAAGREDVPIYCGASDVLSGPGQPLVPQYEAIRDLPHREHWPQDTAIESMRRLILERPGEIVLLSVGPLTNIAYLFGRYPGLRRLLRGWVSMAGLFLGDTEHTDWNTVCDPLSAAIAFAGASPAHHHVGIDVTVRCRLSLEDVKARLQGPLLGVVYQMAEVWFRERKHREAIVFHDPLAAVVPFVPDVCRWERGSVAFDAVTARTSFEASPDALDQIAVDVDVPRFFDEYFRVAGDGNRPAS